MVENLTSMETPLGATIQSVREVAEKHRTYRFLQGECRALQFSLYGVLDILVEADETFHKQKISSHDADKIARKSPLLEGPVRNLESAMATVSEIFESCASSERLNAYIFRGGYQSQLIQAETDVSNAVSCIKREYMSMPGYQTKDATPTDFSVWHGKEREKDKNNMYDRTVTMLQETNIVNDQQDFELQVEDLQKVSGANKLPIVWKTLCNKELSDRCMRRDTGKKNHLAKHESVAEPKQPDDTLTRQKDQTAVASNCIISSSELTVVFPDFFLDHEDVHTQNLIISKCAMNDVGEIHHHLHGDSEVMKLYDEGLTRDIEYTQHRVHNWVERWEKGILFSAFTVRSSFNREFFGIMVLGGSMEENSSELAGLLRQDKWDQGYASEAIAVLKKYALKLYRDRAKLPSGEEFKRIVATCHPDNIASQLLLQNFGFLINVDKAGEIAKKCGQVRKLHFEFVIPSGNHIYDP